MKNPALKEMIVVGLKFDIPFAIANLCTLTIHICNTICNQHIWWSSDVWSQRFPRNILCLKKRKQKASGMSSEMIVRPITSSSQPVLDITTCTNHLNCSAFTKKPRNGGDEWIRNDYIDLFVAPKHIKTKNMFFETITCHKGIIVLKLTVD